MMNFFVFLSQDVQFSEAIRVINQQFSGNFVPEQRIAVDMDCKRIDQGVLNPYISLKQIHSLINYILVLKPVSIN